MTQNDISCHFESLGGVKFFWGDNSTSPPCMWYIWLWSNYFASGRYSILSMTSCFIFTLTFFVQMCQLSVIDKIHRAGSWQLQLRWLTLLEPKYYPILSTQYICTKYYFKRGTVWSSLKIQGMNMSWKQSNKTEHFQTF